jgi:hypothetical protein
LFTPLDSSQDAVWAQDGVMWMASGTKIFQRATRDADWSVVADLSPATEIFLGPSGPTPAVKSITRMAVSRDHKWLAFVAEPASAK